MENITGSNIITAVLVIVAVAGVLVALKNGLEAWRSLTGKDKMEKAEAHQNERLDALETASAEHTKSIERLTGDTSQILESMNALLLHMISGNDVEKLKEKQKELVSYMSKRR